MSKTKTEILWISDQDSLLQQVVGFLTQYGYAWALTKDVARARAIIKAKHRLLVLVDMDSIGVQRTRQIIAMGQPVMLLTANLTADNIRLIYSLGACDYCPVPILDCLLRARIEAQLSILFGRQQIDIINDQLYEFCTPTSHDLKAPFSMAPMLSEALCAELGDRLSDRISRILETLTDTAAHAKDIIEQHYEHARAESCHRGGFVRTTEGITPIHLDIPTD